MRYQKEGVTENCVIIDEGKRDTGIRRSVRIAKDVFQTISKVLKHRIIRYKENVTEIQSHIYPSAWR